MGCRIPSSKCSVSKQWCHSHISAALVVPPSVLSLCWCSNRLLVLCRPQKNRYRMYYTCYHIYPSYTVYIQLTQNMKTKAVLEGAAKGSTNRSTFFPLFQQKELQKYAQGYYYKGYAHHYDLYQEYGRQQLQEKALVFCLDREAVTLALEMSRRKTKTLTYISDTHYETVTIVPNTIDSPSSKTKLQLSFQDHFQTPQSLSSRSPPLEIPKKISKIALYLLKHYRFITKTSFLDNHPLESYKKMCGYVLMQRDHQIVSFFKSPRIGGGLLDESFVVLPFLSELRHKFLFTDKLKLKILPRREGVELTEAMKRSYLQTWKKTVKFQVIETSSMTLKEETVLQWAVANKLGQIVPLEQVLNGRYQHYHYASWH